MRFLIFALIFLVCFSFPLQAKKRGAPWDTIFKPGDKVCIYDIALDDPLIDRTGNSFIYWYRMPIGDQKKMAQLRPMARKLVLKVLWPGITVSDVPDNRGNYWYSGKLVVVEGGYVPSSDGSYLVTKGNNTLFGQKGMSWLLDWMVIDFEKVRLVKKRTLKKCRRTYPKF